MSMRLGWSSSVLGCLALAAGIAIILISIAALHTPLYWVASTALFGVSLCVLALVFFLVALTSSLPTSLVGDGRDLEDPPAAP